MQYKFTFKLPNGWTEVGYSNSDHNSIVPEGGKFAPWNGAMATVKIFTASVSAAFADMMQRIDPDCSAAKNHQTAVTSGVLATFKGIFPGIVPESCSESNKELLIAEYLGGRDGCALFEFSIKSPGGDWFQISTEPIEVSWVICGAHLFNKTMTRRQTEAPRGHSFAPPPSR